MHGWETRRKHDIHGVLFDKSMRLMASCMCCKLLYFMLTVDISYTLAVHPILWAGENLSQIAGAGRSHRVDMEHDNLCILYCENR